ncbi:DNA cytosine methyltransferase [Lacrimispora sphenoides]|uniref:DNA cytosine methyltransferase n=1 Tax=Lacrimispora sphenoides TaxID=29370 RepID=UPI000A594149
MELTDCTGNRQLTHLSLFSGIGGLDLAAEWAGFKSVGQCEWADYPTKVLEQHWPDVPRWRDIRTLTGVSFYERTNRRTVDIISGGFPCQPFSVAGKQRGEDDDRYLWPEMVRVIKELRPTWVVGENVAGIINMALDTVLSDLEAAGYTVRTFLLPACGVNAPHRRYRTAIVGYTKHNGLSSSEIARSFAKASGGEPQRKKKASKFERTGKPGDLPHVADSNCNRFSCTKTRKSDNDKKRNCEAQKQGRGTKSYAFVSGCKAICNTTSQRLQNGSEKPLGEQREKQEPKRSDWWSTEPRLGRVANGIPNRVDRIKCLGNAVVPAQFYPVFQAIADIELGR